MLVYENEEVSNVNPEATYEIAKWLSNWKNRKEFTISRVSGVVTNYQMKLLVGESSGTEGSNVNCKRYSDSTFNDLRFTTSDGTTLLNY